MRKLIALAFAFSSSIAVPGLVVTSASAQAGCGPDAPQEHLRPGGYCDQIKAGKSLTGPNNEGCSSIFYYSHAAYRADGDDGARIQLAADCIIDCDTILGTATDIRALPKGWRVEVAATGCSRPL